MNLVSDNVVEQTKQVSCVCVCVCVCVYMLCAYMHACVYMCVHEMVVNTLYHYECVV